MKKWDIRDCVIAAFAVALIVCIGIQKNQIDRLEQRYYDLQTNTSTKIDLLINQMDRLSLSLKELEEEASFTNKVIYEFGKLHADRGIIDVQITVTPKVMEEDMKAYINLWGVETPLTRDGRAFTGTIPVDLFLTDGEQPLLVFVTDDWEETELLPVFSSNSLWKKYLPSLGVNITNASVSYQENGSDLRLQARGTLEMVKAEAGISFTKISVVARVNGKEILREDITQEVMASDSFQKNGEYASVFELYPEGTLGDEIVMYVEAIDEYGFVHECALVHHRHKSDGATKWYGYDESIYDLQGYLRFGPGKSTY